MEMMESETVVVRGFSNTFGMDKKVDIADLQFIEGEELERAWKTARRQRLKQQEERIWSEFVNEEDVVQAVCKEDPYQFLNQMPEEQVKELVECEVSRIKKELEEKQHNNAGAGDSPRFQKPVVTFNEEENDDVFEIYDDNEDSGHSDQAPEENPDDTLESPCTVRERDDTTSGDNSPRGRERLHYIARASEPGSNAATTKQSNENVTSVIESSIYCAKVKDLRYKIISELKEMITSLETQNIASIEPSQLRKLCKRAGEYSARFQRIHLYQLQRQVNDIKRHNSMSTPYAKHTQFQSQMVRIVGLHQNTLQSLQVFHKSFEHTACLRECSTQLRLICSTIRDGTAACLEVRVPNDLTAALQVYNDNLLSVCDDLEKAVDQYIARVDEYIGAAERMVAASRKRCKAKKGSNANNWSRKGTRDTTSGPINQSLSMYSLDTLRLNSKGGSKHNNKSEKVRLEISRVSKRGKIEKDTPKSHRRTPRRRPLMRDPHAGSARHPRTRTDHDIQTMVENVDSQSSHAGDDQSPPPSFPASPVKRAIKSDKVPHYQLPVVPPIVLARSPRVPVKRTSPYIKPSISNRSETVDTLTTQNTVVAPVHRVQCAKKDMKPNEDATAQNKMPECQTTRSKSPKQRTQSPKGRTQSPTKQTQSSTKQAQPPAKQTESPKNVDSFRGVSSKTRSTSPTSSRCCIDTARSDAARPNVRQNETKTTKRPPYKEAEGYEMTKLLKHICAGDNTANKNDRATGSMNAQLVCVNATSPRQPTTPQLLKILEQTIQKKIPEHMYKMKKTKDPERLRLAFNIPQKIADNLFQYRTKFVQHMLTSSMYANSTIGKPWEVVGSISEQIIDEILMQCAEEMQLKPYIMELYKTETQTQ